MAWTKLGAALLLLGAVMPRGAEGGFKQTESWTKQDASSINGMVTRGYFGATYDGRYVYYVPCRTSEFHGVTLRYDTRGEFTNTNCWEAWDAGETDGLNTKGYGGAVFDGRYVYYVPYGDDTNRHVRVLRFDTQGPFRDAASWSAYDAEGTDGMTGLGYDGGMFDGKYVYFVPYGFDPYAHGYVLRLDTTAPFKSNTSWNAYDASSTGGLDTRGYYGGVWGGSYAYFTPFHDGTNYHGHALRYCTTGEFTQASSWESFNVGYVGGLTNVGYKGAAYDGRYVYYAPFRDETNCHGHVLRYDSSNTFTNVESWTVFDAGKIDSLDTVGFVGAVYDGRYVIFVPYNDTGGETNFHGKMLRFDTQGEFTNRASWSAFQAGYIDNWYTRGYKYGTFDGKYMYFAPYHNSLVFSGTALRYDTSHAGWEPRVATFLGGIGEDCVTATARDRLGNIFVAGWTDSPDFPTNRPLQGALAGGADAFVAKFDPNGILQFSTYLGGSSNDYATTVACDAAGNCYVAGHTLSTNFPTLNALDPTANGNSDAFVVKMTGNGSALVYSTYLGGSGADYGYAITVDTGLCAHVLGKTASTNFPLANPADIVFAGPSEMFLAKLNAAGSAPLYSTYLGGGGDEDGWCVAMDPHGYAVVGGSTTSTNFPFSDPGDPKASTSNRQAVVARLLTDGQVDRVRILGGATSDVCKAIAVDASGNLHLAGITYSADFPLSNACDAVFGGSSEAFYLKTDTNASIVYSTFLGGSYSEEADAVAVDALGQVLVVGSTTSSNFPLRCPLDDLMGGAEMFICRISPGTNGLFMSSFYGGNSGEVAYAAVICPSAVVAVVGQTLSPDLRLLNACDSNMVAAEGLVAIWSGVDDADGDSMTDAHELLYGHNPGDARDGDLDADGDGMLNVEEWITGANPTNKDSRFQIDSFLNGSSLTVNSVSGRLYTIETCQDLVAGVWTNDPAQPVVTGTAAPLSLVATNTGLRTFYRVRVKMP